MNKFLNPQLVYIMHKTALFLDFVGKYEKHSKAIIFQIQEQASKTKYETIHFKAK